MYKLIIVSKSIGIALILLTFTINSVAQEKVNIQQDRMANNRQKNLIRWGNITLGYSLSDKEEILLQDDNAIIIGLNGHPDRIMAKYSFNPVELEGGLQLEFARLKTVILGDFGSESDSESFYRIPVWLTSLCEVEALVLSNAELDNFDFCERLPLKYLDLRKIHFIDKRSVLRTIGKLVNLQIIVHDKSLSDEDLLIIKKKLPNVKFASKK